MEKYDVERLKQDLLDSYGTFGTETKLYSVAFGKLSLLDEASDGVILALAEEEGFDLSEYEVGYERKL